MAKQTYTCCTAIKDCTIGEGRKQSQKTFQKVIERQHASDILQCHPSKLLKGFRGNLFQAWEMFTLRTILLMPHLDLLQILKPVASCSLLSEFGACRLLFSALQQPMLNSYFGHSALLVGATNWTFLSFLTACGLDFCPSLPASSGRSPQRIHPLLVAGSTSESTFLGAMAGGTAQPWIGAALQPTSRRVP